MVLPQWERAQREGGCVGFKMQHHLFKLSCAAPIQQRIIEGENRFLGRIIRDECSDTEGNMRKYAILERRGEAFC